MKLKKALSYFDYVFIIISCSLFIFGTTSGYENVIVPISIASSLFLLGTWLIRGKKITLPKGFILFVLFLATLTIHTFVFGGKIIYSLTFFSGGLFWLIIFNFRHVISKYFFTFLIFMGIIMLGINIGAKTLGITSYSANNLFLPLVQNGLHNHIGDLWAIVLVGLIYKLTQKYRLWQIPLIILAGTLMVFSFSRSAIVSLVIGTIFLYYKSVEGKTHKGLFTIILVVASMLFIFTSVTKTTLFSRPYIGESISSITSSPLGIGIGNFGRVSHESSIAHNIILEIATGMGIFSIIFITWLIKMAKYFMERGSNVLYGGMFLAIFTNFIFDTTYTIPTMIWILFSTLALIEKGEGPGDQKKVQQELHINRKFLFLLMISIVVTSGVFFGVFKSQNKLQAVSIGEHFTVDVKKITNRDFNSAFYSLSVVLVGEVSFDIMTGDALGNFYFKSDPAKNVFSYRLPCSDNNEFYIGTYPAGSEPNPTWEMKKKEDFLNLAHDGAIAQIGEIFRLNWAQDVNTIIDTDKVLSTLKDAEGSHIDIPNNFTFKASSISFEIDN